MLIICAIYYFHHTLKPREDDELLIWSNENISREEYILNKVLGSAVLILQIYFYSIEIRQMAFQKWKYWVQPLNYLDLINNLMSFFLVVTLLRESNNYSLEVLRMVASWLSCTTLLKTFDMLRLFESTAFYMLLTEKTLAPGAMHGAHMQAY